MSNPPTNLGIVRVRPCAQLNRILVPVAGGPNGRLALSLAISLAQSSPENTQIVLLHVMLTGSDQHAATARGERAFRQAANGIEYPNIDKRMVTAATPLAGILEEAEKCDLVIIGATKEPLFRNLLLGNVAHQVVEQTTKPTIVVKRQSSIVASMLRETVLSPVHRSPKLTE